MSAASRTVTSVVAALALMGVMTSCYPADPRALAIQSARTSWLDAVDTLNELAPDIQPGGFHEFFADLTGGDLNTYLLDENEAAVRSAAYALQGQSAFVFEATEADSLGTVLLYVSGFSETGGGGTYKKDIVFSCASVDIDLTEHRVVSYEAADCTDSLYAVRAFAGELDFDDIANPDDVG